MKFLKWYSTITLSLTVLVAASSNNIIGMIWWIPTAVYGWMHVFRKENAFLRWYTPVILSVTILQVALGMIEAEAAVIFMTLLMYIPITVYYWRNIKLHAKEKE